MSRSESSTAIGQDTENKKFNMDRVKPIEEALDMTGYGHYNINLFMYFSCIVISMTFEYFGTFYLLPPIASDFNISSSQQGLITQFQMIGVMAFGMKWGYFADTKGRKTILQIALVMAFLSSTTAAFSPHWIALLVLKCISAVAVGGIFVSSLALLTECTPIRKRSSLVILTMSTFLVAIGTMAVMSMSVLTLRFSFYFLGIYFTAWRLLGLLFALPSIICVFGVKYIFESPKYLLHMERNDEALEVLKGMYVTNNRVSSDNYEVDALILDEDKLDTRHMNHFKSYITTMLSVVKNRSLCFTLLVNLLLTGFLCTYFYMGVLPVVATAYTSTDVNRTTYLTVCEVVRGSQNTTTVEEGKEETVNKFSSILVFAVGIALAGLNMVVFTIFKFVNRKRLIFGIQVLVAVSSLCINFCPVWALNAILYVFILFGTFNVGLLCTYAVDIFPSYGKATALGLTMAASLGSVSFASTHVMKFLQSNCEVSFYILLGIACLGVLLSIFLPSEEKVSGLIKLLQEPEKEKEDISMVE